MTAPGIQYPRGCSVSVGALFTEVVPFLETAVSILAAAIAFAGSEVGARSEMIVPAQHGDDWGVFHLRGGKVRFCELFSSAVQCTNWD